MVSAATPLKKDWINILFLTATPILAIGGIAVYTWRWGFAPWMALLFLTMYILVGLSICAGYHRFFSHKSYEASAPVQAFFAFFGAMAAQNSILWWSSGHRTHHHYVDRDWDPYNIRRGFWWAHILWIFYRNPAGSSLENVADLQKNPIVLWQNRWHKLILILGGFGLPTLVGALFGHPVAGLLWGGFLRVAVIHHTTFFVNSLAHSVGSQEYDPEVSARDSWLVALVSLGEGYHSFHHRFPADFRNGIHWYHWDPAKWFIRALRAVGLASGLRSTAAPLIERARLAAAVRRVEHKLAGIPPGLGEEALRRFARARETVEHAFALWREHAEQRAQGTTPAERQVRRRVRRTLREARREWRLGMRILASPPLAEAG